MMSRADIESVIDVLERSPIHFLDLTGGAPELHPEFRFLVTAARGVGCRIMVRSNLVIFFEPGQAYLPSFYRENEVELIASLPSSRAANVDAVRGNGVFEQCVKALKILNDHGYADENGRLKLHLVHNPRGAFLPPTQESLEAEYRKELQDNFGIRFNHLYTFANMPLGRFKDFLVRSNGYDLYMEKLRKAFNPAILDGIMCRRLLSVGWDGTLADCDFNLAAGIPVTVECPGHIRDFDYERLGRRRILVSEHCFGCTAGQGST